MADNKDKTTSKNSNVAQDPGRRKFIKNTGVAAGGVVGGTLLGGLIGNPFKSEEPELEKKEKVQPPTEARMFFTRYEDFVVLEQATERIYPKDDNGPGAIILGVPYFIDKQLAGPWGQNADDYRLGPFNESNPSSSMSRLTRKEIFLNGIRKMNALSQKQFDVSFNEAEEEQQIEILEYFEDDEVDMKGVSSSGFFDLLRGSVLEGAFSDPLYGGNRNMEGWKMKEFPGAVPSYADIIEEEEFIKMDPVSLTDYQQKT